MAHHAYFITGESEQGIEQALLHAEQELGLVRENNPDLIVMRHGLFSVEDARKLSDMAQRAAMNGERKAIVVSALRLFHEAQNALLKIFEEPPAGTTLLLVVPSEGMLLPTLRSRLLPLPSSQKQVMTKNWSESRTSPIAQEFLQGSATQREKIIEKLLDRTKSDKDEEKQTARNQAVQLVEGLMQAAYAKREIAFLSDLDAFLPILHERSAPLKLIFEHILLVIPRGLNKEPV